MFRFKPLGGLAPGAIVEVHEGLPIITVPDTGLLALVERVEGIMVLLVLAKARNPNKKWVSPLARGAKRDVPPGIIKRVVVDNPGRPVEKNTTMTAVKRPGVHPSPTGRPFNHGEPFH